MTAMKPNPTSVSGMDRFSLNQEGERNPAVVTEREVTFGTL